MSKISYAITTNNITVNFNGQTHTISRSDAAAAKIIQALKEKRIEDLPDLVSAATRLQKYSQGTFQVVAGEVMIGNWKVPEFLSKKILNFQAEGLPYEPLVKFAEKLQQNPSFRSVNELSVFLEKNEHPITEEGNFIAYKRVRSDFKDIYSGTIDNSPGTEPSMSRNAVDDNCERTCSSGLHVANWHYAHTQFGSHNRESDIMIEVEVNPADVVSIPVDYNNAKMRVCKYKVLGVIDHEHSSEVQLRSTSAAPSVNEDSSEDAEDDCSCDCGCEDSEDEKDQECDDCCEYCDEHLDDCYCEEY